MEKTGSASTVGHPVIATSSSDSPFLSDEEVNAICAGRTQNAAKTRYLESLGLKVCTKPNGSPLVGRKHFELVMCGNANDFKGEPKWSIL